MVRELWMNSFPSACLGAGISVVGGSTTPSLLTGFPSCAQFWRCGSASSNGAFLAAWTFVTTWCSGYAVRAGESGTVLAGGGGFWPPQGPPRAPPPPPVVFWWAFCQQ